MTLTYDIANWMSLIVDSKSLTELSIPGTHDSAAMKRPGFDDSRLTTQSRTIQDQLESGVRFLDLRAGYVNKQFGMYHEDISLNLSFGEVLGVMKQFLQDHPRETIIASIKNEYEGSGNDPNVGFQARLQGYIDESSRGLPKPLWYLQNAIPKLDSVRGQIVLFRRFPLDARASSIGINAYDNFPNKETKTIAGPPRLTIQDEYSLVSPRSLDTLLPEKWQAVEALLNQASSLKEPGTLYVNFGSAAGRFDSDSFPRPVAAFINPKFAGYFAAKSQGRFGIIPRDFEALFAPNLNTVIAHSNVPYDAAQFFFLKSKRDGDVVDVQHESTVAGTPLIAFPQKTSGTDNQLWRFVSHIPPYFFIAVKQTGQVITIKDANETAGAAVTASPQTTPAADNQLWMLMPSDETATSFFITSKLTRAVITIDEPQQAGDTPLVVRPRKTEDNDDQLWSVVKSG